jgi:beta-glucosidase
MRGNDAASNAGSEGEAVTPFPIDYKEGADAGYRWYAKTGAKPLFPFGYGLSYTRFGYSHLTVTGGDTPTVSFDVTNLGQRAGADVPQIYVTVPGGKAPRLAAFQRVALAPGETRHVTLSTQPRVLAQWDQASAKWQMAGGTYTITLGHDVTDPGLSKQVRLGKRQF